MATWYTLFDVDKDEDLRSSSPAHGHLHFIGASDYGTKLAYDPKVPVSENIYGYRGVEIRVPSLICFHLKHEPTLIESGGIQVWLWKGLEDATWEGLPRGLEGKGEPGFIPFFIGRTHYSFLPHVKGIYSFEVCTGDERIRDAGVNISMRMG